MDLSPFLPQLAALHKRPCRELSNHCRTAYDPDKTGDLFRALLAKTRQIYNGNAARYRCFYDALCIPADPFEEVADQDEHIGPRRPVMCHCDVHRKNLILTNGPRLVILDWELTLVADPFYDLAVHFHKMRYEVHQERVFLEEYARTSDLGSRPESISEQVGIYLRLERVKSALVDAIRLENDLRSSRLPDEMRVHLCSRYQRKLGKAYAVWGIKEECLPDPSSILDSAEASS